MIIYMNHRGFTVIELIIVITVMGILMTVGVVNLSGTRANGRDAERKGDVESIVMHLESYYISGTDGSTTTGRYPGTDELIGNETVVLRDIDPEALIAPGKSSSVLTKATNSTQTTAGVTPQPTIDSYVYQPIQSDGSLCTLSTQECQKFNLYYKLEVDNIVYMVTSKNQ